MVGEGGERTERFISIALVFVLADGLTARFGRGDKQVATKTPRAATTEGTIKAMEQGGMEGAARDVIIIVFYYIAQTTKRKGLKAVKEVFMGEHPEYQIAWDNVFYNQGTDYFPQLRTVLASGDQPEVIMGNPGLYLGLVTEDCTADLIDNAVIKGLNLPSGDLEDVSHDGKIYGFPIDSKTRGILYNKKVFVDNGIEEPKAYAKLLAACEKLNAAGIGPWVHAFNDAAFGDTETRSYIRTKVLEVGGKDLFEKLMNGEKKLADYPYFEEGPSLQAKRSVWMRDDATTNDQDAALGVSVSGEAAMVYFGTWGIGDLEPTIGGRDFGYGFFVEPTGGGGSVKLSVQVDQSLTLNPQAENYDVTLEFTEHWVQNGGDSWSAIPLMSLLNGSVVSNVPEVVQILARLKISGDISHYGDLMAPSSDQSISAWRAYLAAFTENHSNDMKQSTRQCLDDMQAKFNQVTAGQ